MCSVRGKLDVHAAIASSNCTKCPSTTADTVHERTCGVCTAGMRIDLTAGWWRWNSTRTRSKVLHACPFDAMKDFSASTAEAACTGGGLCHRNYTGIMCQACSSNYTLFSSGDQSGCIQCPPTWYLSLTTGIGLVLCMLALSYLVKKNNQSCRRPSIKQVRGCN